MKKGLLILLAIITCFVQVHAAYHLTNGPQMPWESPVLNLGSNIFELTPSYEYWITDDDGDGWGGFGSSLSLPIEKKEGTLGVGGLMIKVTDPGFYEIILEAPESKTLIVSMHRVYKVDKIDCQGNVVESIYSLTDDDDISLGHSWSEYVSDGDATCTVDGHKTAHCTVEGCDATDQVTDQGSALGHSWGEYVLDGDQTCTEDGHKTASCTREGCTATNQIVVEGTALGHSWGEYILDGDQTCTEDGHKTASCTREGCTATNQIEAEGAALGHAFTNYVYNNDATKLADGTETAECDHGCGTTDTRTAVGTMLPGTVTTVNEVDAEKQHAKKYIENGMLIIEVNSVKYDVTGRVVK